MWMTWQEAAWLALGCALFALVTRHVTSGLVVTAREIAREVSIVAALYALWQRVFALTVTETKGAFAHGRAIYDFEQRIGLPSERSLQTWAMKTPWLIEALNRYYAYVHVMALGLTLVWLFFRHRERFPAFRNVLALATLAALAMQAIPVAPPRFYPDLGFVDTALLYRQSVYGAGGSGLSNQLAAMPSVHVAWSVLIAGIVMLASTSKWRWVIIVHPVVTIVAVVATGNHWWLDGIVSVILIGLSVAVVAGVTSVGRHLHVRGADRPTVQESGQSRSPERVS